MKKYFLLLIFALQACGQTGHLYLPDQEAPIHVEKEEL